VFYSGEQRTLSDVAALARGGKGSLAAYCYSACLDDFEAHQLVLLQRLARSTKWRMLRKRVVRAVLRLQRHVRGFLVRRRLAKAARTVAVRYAARLIQKVYRGHLVRRRLCEFLAQS